MTVGNLVGGKLADHYDPLSAAMISLSLLVIVLLLLVFVSADKVMVTIMTFMIGGVAFAIVPPAQIMMMRSAKEAEMLGSAIGARCNECRQCFRSSFGWFAFNLRIWLHGSGPGRSDPGIDWAVPCATVPSLPKDCNADTLINILTVTKLIKPVLRRH